MKDLTVFCDMYQLPIDENYWPSYVTAYHLTPSKNVESILNSGLTAKPCKATRYGESRQDAVYLLAAKVDTHDSNIRDFLFDDSEISVVEIRIPQDAFGSMRTDGLFNMSCICTDGSCPTGMQYTNDIPADWIVK